MVPFAKKTLVFSDGSDLKLSVGKRVERFVRNQDLLNLSELAGADARKFHCAVYCMFSQAMDTILASMSIAAHPFIRGYVPITYVMLMMESFRENRDLDGYLEKVLVGYFLGLYVKHSDFVTQDYQSFSTLIAKDSPYDRAMRSLEAARSQNGRIESRKINSVITKVMELLKRQN